MPLAAAKRAEGLTAVVGVCDDGEVALFDGVPVPVSGGVTAPGTEVGSDGGYEPQPVTSADWSLDGDEITATLDFGPATEAWDMSPRYWLWRDGSGVAQMWGQLRRPVYVAAAADAVPVELVVTWVDPTQSEV